MTAPVTSSQYPPSGPTPTPAAHSSSSGSWPIIRRTRTMSPVQPHARHHVWYTRRSDSQYSMEIPPVPVTAAPQSGQNRGRSCRCCRRSGSHQWAPPVRLPGWGSGTSTWLSTSRYVTAVGWVPRPAPQPLRCGSYGECRATASSGSSPCRARRGRSRHRPRTCPSRMAARSGRAALE